MKIAVLGGAGAMGKITVTDLHYFSSKEDEIIVGDYDFNKAKALCNELKNPRMKPVALDLKNHQSAVKTLQGCEILINCAQYQLNIEAMKIALDLKAHYVDLGGLFHITRKQLELHAAFLKNSRLAVLGMGAAPGITNLLSALCAGEFDTVEEIHTRVGSMDKTKYEPQMALPVSYSLKTILEEFSFEPAVFTKGKLTFVKSMSGATPHYFPKPIGKQNPMFTIHSEVATLPLSYAKKGVKEVSFKIAFDPDFVEKVRFLRDLGMASHEVLEFPSGKASPIDVVNKVAMAQPQAKAVGKLKQHEVVRAIVKGTIKGKKQTRIADCHTTGIAKWGMGLDVDTGCPPSIVALMIARGEIKTVGALPPETALDPKRFFKHLASREMKVKTKTLPGWSFKV